MRTILIAMLPLGLWACQSQTNDNFVNPPPGPPATCTVDTSVEGCSGGSVGYACSGDRPDDGDTNLVCSRGTPGAAGVTLYCCAPYGQYWSDCTVDTGIAGCVGDAFGFSCSGASSVSGDPAIPTPDPTSPADADATLACSASMPSGADLLYCCTSAIVPPTCAVDATASCTGVGIGYACVGGDSPDRSVASLACTAGPQGAAESQRCCIPFAQSPDGCQVAAVESGCADDAYAFSCAGAVTPEQVNPALACDAGTSSGGTRSFCCQLGQP